MQAKQVQLEAVESLIKKYQTSIRHVQDLKDGLGPNPNPATLVNYNNILRVDEANMKDLQEKVGELRRELRGYN